MTTFGIEDLVAQHGTTVPVDVKDALSGDHLAISASVYLFTGRQLYDLADAIEKRSVALFIERINCRN